MENTKRRRHSCGTKQDQGRPHEPILNDDSNVFSQMESMFGPGCFNKSLLPETIMSIYLHHIRSSKEPSNTLARVVEDGLTYVKEGKKRIYEVAEALFIMALLCSKCDTNNEHNNLISKIIRLQMEAVSLVTEAGWPWTRQLSISRWFTFLSTSPEDRQMLNLFPPEEASDHVTALRYYLSGARDVVFRLPFRVEASNSPSTAVNEDMQVPEGFSLQDVHLFDFPIRRSQDNSTMTPLGLACQSVSPSIILVLLQQGAAPVLFQAGLTETPLGQLTEPLSVLFRMLNKCRTWRDWDIGGINPGMLDSLRTQEKALEKSLIKCVNLMMRALTHIPIQFFENTDERAMEKNMGFGKGPNGQNTFLLMHHYRHLVPKDRINCVGDLQHLCRLRIRNVLHDNKRLPDAIEQLPVTWVLVPYLNFAC